MRITILLSTFWLAFWFCAPLAEAAGATTAPPAPDQVTLKEAYDSALSKTETIPIEDARTRQVEERLRQGRGRIYPELDFKWDYLHQDTQNISVTGPTATSVRADATTSRLSATQHLFQGFREFAGVESLEANLQAQRFVRENTRLSLLGQVAQAFYSALANERDYANLSSLIGISERRIRDLQSFTRLGRSRRSDLLSSRSQLATLRAQAAQADSARMNSREQLTLLTGLSADAKLADTPETLPQRLEPLDNYLAKLDDRPDLKALREQERSAEAGTRVARGTNWPTLDLNGNYYLHRTGLLEGSDWDIGLSLVFPLYQGGVATSQVREATEFLTERRLVVEQAKRTARRDIASAYKLASSGLDQLRLVREALDLSKETYDAINHDYRVGATTNLEVLQALNSLEAAQRAYDRAYFDTLIALRNLSVAQGRLP